MFFRHRPGQDATLKNDTDGERPVAISEHVAEVLDEYVAVNRIEQNDDHDRRPLFTTQHGRMSKGSIRRHVYQITQPCHYGTCPHDREPDDCEALEHGFEARCPSSREPHALRSGSIVHHRDQGWHPAEVSERVDAGVDVIEAHYDHEESLRRMASRRTNVEQLEDD